MAAIEERINLLKFRNGYSGIIIQKEDGSRWFKDKNGNYISEKDADPDLIPQACLVLPEKM